MDTLYTYQCKSCNTLAVAAFKRLPNSAAVRCSLCRWPMTYMWSDPVTTDEQRAWHAKGIVYNPGVEPKKPGGLTCDTCGARASLLYGVLLVGVGLFCSAKCADDGVKKHEAAMEKPSASLMATGE